MRKELNPELFGVQHMPKGLSTDTGLSGYVQSEGDPGVTLVKDHEAKIQELKQQLHRQAEQFSSWASQITEFVKGTHLKFERLQQHISRLEQNHHQLQTEVTQKISHIQSKLGERKSIDQKTNEMVDRHNSVLRSYEVRMSQLQRLISERESQVVQAQSALNETKMEITRLKRL